MATVEERISNMLIKWLLDEKDILAESAYFYGTTSGLDDGCDTCGYGSTEMGYEIVYRPVGATTNTWLELTGDPLDLLPVLLKYDV